jgi:beta-lactamase class A
MPKLFRYAIGMGVVVALGVLPCLPLRAGVSTNRGSAAMVHGSTGRSGAVLHYLANDGMVLESGSHRVVIDFPFSGTFSWCVSPSEAQIQALLERKPPFETVDLFLFTHDHVDHFDPLLVKKALAAHPEAALAGTTRVLDRLRKENGAPISNPLFEAQAGRPFEWKELNIEPLKAPHARYWDIDPATGKRVTYDDGYIHIAYHVAMNGFSFVHGGDAQDIAFPAEMKTDLLLLDRGFIRNKGLPALKELRQRLGAPRTVLMHLGPAEINPIKPLIAAESEWLSALTERDQVIAMDPAAAPCPGLVPPGPKPELYLPVSISGPLHNLVVRFRPGGDELYLMRWDAASDKTAILRFLCREGSWRDAGTAPIPFAGNIAYPFISPDGERLYFDGTEPNGLPDIWCSPRQGEGWGPPARLGPEVNSGAIEMLSSVAANGDIFFSSNRPGGLGGFDLYFAKKTAQGYEPAKNLGPAVNSAEFESHPFIAPDESYLLFDSRRQGGWGSNDIFISFKKPDGGWTAAQNLGPEINSSAGDMRPYVAPGGRALFFCSDRTGKQEIWWVDVSVIERCRVPHSLIDKPGKTEIKDNAISETDRAGTRLADLEKKLGGRLGVAALDTAAGRSIAFRAGERFAMASTFKVLLAAAVLRRVDQKMDTLDRLVPFGKDDLLAHAPITQKNLDKGRLSVLDLCAAIIEVSDNTAANLLLKSIGGPAALTRFAREIGDPTTRLDRDEPELNSAVPGDERDTTTPAAMLSTLEKLLLGSHLSAASRQRLETWMMQCSTGGRRLRAGLPAGWRCGDKTGTGANGSTNDIAILWPPGRRPILVAVYSTGSPLPTEESEAIVAEAARIIAAELGT